MTERLDPAIKAANKIKFGKIRSDRMKGEGNSFYGKQHSQESIEKNRSAHIGKPSPRKGATLSHESKEKIYFVIETKGTMIESGRRGFENQKIECAKRHFEVIDVRYKDVSNYKQFEEMLS